MCAFLILYFAGTLTIGSHNCDVNLNGSGVQPLHCTVKRSLNGEVTIYPELDARTLIDCSKINEETKLTQGTFLFTLLIFKIF